MSENAKKNLDRVVEQMGALPQDLANDAINQFAAKMEGFAEGYAAGKAHAEQQKGE